MKDAGAVTKEVGGFAGSLDSETAKDAVIVFAAAATGLMDVMNAAKQQIDLLKAQNADLQVSLNGEIETVRRLCTERNSLQEQIERIQVAVDGF